MTGSLDRRTLNRTLLSRQWLSSRSTGSALDVVEHLVGLQAQSPTAPYVGLYSRLARFSHQNLSDLLLERSAVRIVVMRGTVHLVRARDAIALRNWVQPGLDRGMHTTWGRQLVGIDLDQLAIRVPELLDRGPLSTADLGKALAAHWPDHERSVLVNAARTLLPLVQVPPRGVWGRSGQATYATAHAWLGVERGEQETPDFAEQVFLRYLTAFGPASVKDVQTWSGLTRLSEIAGRLGSRLRRYRNQDGVELLDVADLPLADPGETVEPIFVAPYDNLILSHADRSRVISDEDRAAISTKNAVVPGTFLIDGFVAGTWRVATDKKEATLVVAPFRKLSKKDTAALDAPAQSLAEFVADEAASHQVRVDQPS